MLFWLFFIPGLLVWLGFCILLSLPGLLNFQRTWKMPLDKVKASHSVCRYLHSQGLLTDKEYAFETDQVALFYSGYVYVGYLFIFRPLLYLMTKSNHLLAFMHFLVILWMRVHRSIFAKQNGHIFLKTLIFICTQFSGLLGRSLVLLSIESVPTELKGELCQETS